MNHFQSKIMDVPDVCHSHCKWFPDCRCFKSKFGGSLCRGCNEDYIEEGDCITRNEDYGWRHAACPTAVKQQQLVLAAQARPGVSKCQYAPHCGCLKAQFSKAKCPGCEKDPIVIGDCLTKLRSGKWVHTKCPSINGNVGNSIEDRLLPTRKSAANLFGGSSSSSRNEPLRLMNGSSPSNGGSSMANNSTSTPTKGGNANANIGSSTPSAGSHRATSSRNAESALAIVPVSDRSGQKKSKWTEEQESFRKVDLQPGMKIRGNARAGSGKTTMAALLCESHLKKNPSDSIAYFVFGKKNQSEAASSGKFDVNRVDIQTTHAVAKKHVFNSSAPTMKIDRFDVSRMLGLFSKALTRISDNAECGSKFDEHNVIFRTLKDKQDFLKNKAKIGRVARSLAGYVIGTVTKFCQSIDGEFTSEHVPRNALVEGKATRWKKLFTSGDYIDWATQMWTRTEKEIKAGHHDRLPPKPGNHTVTPQDLKAVPTFISLVSHDAYLKYMQLQGTGFLENVFSSVDIVILDECQDLTPCQSDIFFEGEHLEDKAVVILGDQYQRIYGWRGAKENFESSEVDFEFELSTSFRFGPVVAKTAERLLAYGGIVGRGDRKVTKITGAGGLPGASIGPSDIHELTEEKFKKDYGGKIVYLTRSNKGMLDVLNTFRKSLGRPLKWTMIGGEQSWEKAGIFNPKDYEKFCEFYERCKNISPLGGVSHERADDAAGAGRMLMLEDIPTESEASGRNAGSFSSSSFRQIVPVNSRSSTRGSTSDSPFAIRSPFKSLLDERYGDLVDTPFEYDGEEFEDWQSLVDHCRETGQNLVLTRLKIVEGLYEKRATDGDPMSIISEISRAAVTDESWEVQLGTTHSAKGLEFSQTVFLHDDFQTLQNDETGDLFPVVTPSDREVTSVLYVAVTRAQSSLRLARKVWRFLQALGVEEEDEDDGDDFEGAGSSSSSFSKKMKWGETFSLTKRKSLDKGRKRYEKEWELFDKKRAAYEEGTREDSLSSSSEGKSSSSSSSRGKSGSSQGNHQVKKGKKKATGDPLKLLKAIPKPPQGVDGGNPLALHPEMKESDVKSTVRKAYLRYHPDKWTHIIGEAKTNAENESATVKKNSTLKQIKQIEDFLNEVTNALSDWLKRDYTRDPMVPQRGEEDEDNGYDDEYDEYEEPLRKKQKR